MSSFKEIVQEDIKYVFIDIDEFGDTHNVDGKNITIIIDDNEQIEREKRATGNYTDGIFKKNVLFYVKAEDLEGLPSIGRLMILDNKSYKVTDAINEDGIYSISLEANRN